MQTRAKWRLSNGTDISRSEPSALVDDAQGVVVRVNYGAHFCEGHGHYDAECPSCASNVGSDEERKLVLAYLRRAAVLRKGVRELMEDIERGEHLK